MIVVKRFLTRKNEQEYKKIFQACFTDSWKNSVPFARDPVYTAVDEDGVVLGFCMVHTSFPGKPTLGAGSYMYNLCVQPNHRMMGAATLLVQHVEADHPKCYAHMTVKSRIMNRWKQVSMWREKYVEYALGFDTADTADTQYTALVTTHYDGDENLIYLS